MILKYGYKDFRLIKPKTIQLIFVAKGSFNLCQHFKKYI